MEGNDTEVDVIPVNLSMGSRDQIFSNRFPLLIASNESLVLTIMCSILRIL